MRTFVIIGILALAVAVSVPAFAEVQNVKVGGDIKTYVIVRNNFDLEKDTRPVAAGATDSGTWFMSAAGVNVGADLTDKVAATVRLITQRDWGLVDAPTSEVDLDLGYVSLKELFGYQPLTLTVGRQDIVWGRGFVMGGILRDPAGSIVAHELSEVRSLDAIRAVLDYAPFTVDLLYSKINDTAPSLPSGTDTDAYGINVGYKFDDYNAEAEAYYIYVFDDSTLVHLYETGTGVAPPEPNIIDTLGVRGSLDPLDNLTLAGEVAYQWGTQAQMNFGSPRNTNTVTRDRRAYAVDLSAEYRLPDIACKPKVGAGYILYSGEAQDDGTGDYRGWFPMLRTKFDTLIHEFIDNPAYNNVTNYAEQRGGLRALPYTNLHQILLKAGAMPMDDLSVDATFAILEAQKNVFVGTDKSIGQELDVYLRYGYTEDVSFGLAGGYFWTGDYYQNSEDASEVIGSMVVAF